MLALWGYLIGYEADYTFVNIGDAYQGAMYAYLRMLPAFFSAGVPPFAYLAADALGLSEPAALVASAWLLFDNCVVGEGKFILVDSQLFFWTVFAMWAYFRSRTARKFTREWQVWLFLTGMGLCFTFSVKWTGLGLVGIVGLDVAVGLLADLAEVGDLDLWLRDFFTKLVLLLLWPMCVYFFIFFLHFWLLPKTGSGDAFMSNEFKARLIGTTVPAGVEPQSTLMSVFELHRVMFVANEGLSAEHFWGSRWYQWPVMAGRGVLYWTGPGAKIYLLGNPMVWWGTTAVTLISLFLIARPALVAIIRTKADHARGRVRNLDEEIAGGGTYGEAAVVQPKLQDVRRRQAFVVNSIFFLCGIAANWLPYALIRRVCFVYHYIPTIIQGGFLAATVLDYSSTRIKLKWSFSLIIISLIAYVFFLFTPWTFGEPTKRNLQWVASWV